MTRTVKYICAPSPWAQVNTTINEAELVSKICQMNAKKNILKEIENKTKYLTHSNDSVTLYKLLHNPLSNKLN